MLAPERHPYHAMYTEVLIIEFPKTHELVNYGFLLDPAAQFRDVTRIFDHADCIEVGTQGK